MIYSFAEFALDLQRYELRCVGQVVKIEPQVFNLIAYLIRHRDRLITKEELLEQLWAGRIVSEATLTSRVRAARKALGDDGREQRLIQTLHGRGYRFIAPIEEQPGDASDMRHSPPSGRLASASVPDTGHLPARQALNPPAPPPFSTKRVVGRAAELTELHGRLQQALRGTRQVVFVTGEAGLGKTTMVEAFLADLSAYGSLWIGRGQCLEQYGPGEAYMPVLDAIGRLCREPLDPSFLSLLVRQAPTWVVQMPWLVDDAMFETLERRALGATRERMLREMAEAVEVLSVERPIVLVLEDLHWSDASTIDLIALLARRREPARLLLLGTYRPAALGLQAHPLQTVKQELGVHRQCHEVALPLLTTAEVRAYLEGRFPGVVFPVEMRQFLHQRSDGNPLFMASILDYWQGQGLPGDAERPLQLLEWFRTLTSEVPDTLRKMIEQQLMQLDPADQRLLEAACVAGKEFAAAVVAAALDQPTEHIESCLDMLARRGQFVRAHGVAAWPDGTVASRYAFIHDVYREVLYNRVPAGRRTQWHRHIGGRLETGYEVRAPELATELAEHFVRARDLERALRYLQCAGENALRRSAYHEAIAHLTRSLEVLADLPATPQHTLQELHLQVALGAALTANQGFASAAAGQAYTRALELSRQVAETQQLAPVRLGLWVYYHVRTELQTAHVLGEEILRQAQTWQEPTLLVQAHHTLGVTSTDLGHFPEALRHLQQALALYTREQHHAHLELSVYDPGAICLAFAAQNLWYLGYPEQAVQRRHEALTLAQELAHPYTTAGTLCLAAVSALLMCEWEQALEWAETVVALSREQGFPYFSAWGTIVQGAALSALGRPHQGILALRQGLDRYRATGAAVLHTYWAVLLAETLGRVGEAEEGIGLLESALATIPGSGERRSEAELYRCMGALLQASPDGTHAADMTPQTCFQRALDIAQRQHAKSLELRAAVSLGRLWIEQGKRPQAHQLLANTYSWFGEGFETTDLQTARAVLEASS